MTKYDQLRTAAAFVEPQTPTTEQLARRIERRREALAKERHPTRRIVRAIFLREDEDEMIRRVTEMGGAA